MNITWGRSVRAVATVVAVSGFVMGIPAFPGAAPDGDRPSSAAPAQAVDPDYTAAIPLLEAVIKRDAGNANAYNWLGYATRKSGNAAASIPIYQKALAIDPKHKGAHEYIGEAYLMLGDLPKAKEHLARLNSLCFFSCEEYRDLKKAVEQYEKSGGKTSGTR